MPRTNISRGAWLHSIGNRAVRNSVNALIDHSNTAYKAALQSYTGTTLTADTDLSVQVAGNTTYLISGKLPVAISAAAGNIKLDFNAGSAAIVAGTLGGSAALALTGVASTIVPLTALNTLVDGGVTNVWTEVDFSFVCQVATGGTIQLEVAQHAASGTLSVSPGAYMVAQPLDHVINN